MALKNYQYNEILREYDLRRSKNHSTHLARRNELREVCPEYFDVETEIIENSVKAAREVIFDRNSNIQERTVLANSLLENKKKDILISHGYSPDYLEPIYTCPKCKDTGYINDEKCTCFKQLVSDMIYNQSNIKEQLTHENFTKFSLKYFDGREVLPDIEKTAQQNMYDISIKAKKFIEDFDKPEREFSNFLFTGNSGLGKTFMSLCIAKELLDTAHTVIYFTAFHFFELLSKSSFSHEGSYDGENLEDFRSQFEHILDCDLLIIDDLGTEVSNSFTNSQLNLCINERLLNGKATIISTNFKLSELSTVYSERVFSRLASFYTIIRFVGKDVRLRKKLEK